MDNEGKNGAQTDKQAVLGRLRDTKALYVVVSACTKLPYVVCDTETFDDEVLVFFKPEEAEAKAKSLAGGGSQGKEPGWGKDPGKHR